jgi:hypothetical protein
MNDQILLQDFQLQENNCLHLIQTICVLVTYHYLGNISSKYFYPSILKVKNQRGGQEFWVFVMKLKYSLLSFLAILQWEMTTIVDQKIPSYFLSRFGGGLYELFDDF